MRFCPTLCLLLKGDVLERTLDRDVLGSRFVECEEHFALFYKRTNHESQVRHGTRNSGSEGLPPENIFRTTHSSTSENTSFLQQNIAFFIIEIYTK